MKAWLRVIALVSLLACSGCLIREERGGDRDHYWHDHEHFEHDR